MLNCGSTTDAAKLTADAIRYKADLDYESVKYRADSEYFSSWPKTLGEATMVLYKADKEAEVARERILVEAIDSRDRRQLEAEVARERMLSEAIDSRDKRQLEATDAREKRQLEAEIAGEAIRLASYSFAATALLSVALICTTIFYSISHVTSPVAAAITDLRLAASDFVATQIPLALTRMRSAVVFQWIPAVALSLLVLRNTPRRLWSWTALAPYLAYLSCCGAMCIFLNAQPVQQGRPGPPPLQPGQQGPPGPPPLQRPPVVPPTPTPPPAVAVNPTPAVNVASHPLSVQPYHDQDVVEKSSSGHVG